MIGGTEVAWKDGRWLLHVHLLAIGVNKADWNMLRSRWPRVGVAIPIKVDQLKDVERQLSYLQKFVTYHRPGARLPSSPTAPTSPTSISTWVPIGHRQKSGGLRKN